MTAVDILVYIATHKAEFPNLHGLSPAQVLAGLPTEDARYRLGEEGAKSGVAGGEIAHRRGTLVAHSGAIFGNFPQYAAIRDGGSSA